MLVGGQSEEAGRVQSKGENPGGDDLRAGEDLAPPATWADQGCTKGRWERVPRHPPETRERGQAYLCVNFSFICSFCY